MKCVMIIDDSLPAGVAANTAAALGVSLSGRIEGLVGESLIDGDGRFHEGLTNIPIPILALSKEELKEKHDRIKASGDPEILLIGFSETAQRSLDYKDYAEKLRCRSKERIDYLGICIYGPRRKVNKLTGSLRMLR